MRLATLQQIASIFACDLKSEVIVKGYSIDSRKIKPGELYFALPGEQTDGHLYLEEVKQKGGCGAVVSNSYPSTLENFPLLRVSHPLQALQKLASHFLAHSSTRVVAVTGSVGKTSTKEFIKTLLSCCYDVAASLGNANSKIGLPLTLLNHTSGQEQIVVLEMGMTEAGHLSDLLLIAPPEVAVLTAVAFVHASSFDSLQAIAHAKGEIFSHSSTKLGILPFEVPFFDLLKKKGFCQKQTFSLFNPEASYSFTSSSFDCLHSKIENRLISLKALSLPGDHNRYNLLAALAVARYFKVSWEALNSVIPTLKLMDKRLQFVTKKEILFLDDSYNASEISVKAALEILPSPPSPGRKIAVIGSLLELGKFSDECHTRVAEHALKYVDKLYCLGEECLPMVEVWQRAKRPVQHFLSLKELIDCLKQQLCPADVVLLKGSHSKKMWEVLEKI